MNKYIIYILSMVLFAACKGKQTSTPSDTLLTDTTPAQSKTDTVKIALVKDTVFKPYKLIDDFIVTDTGYYDFTLGSSVYLVVKRNNRLVDTIDKYTDLRKVDDDVYLYQLVTTRPLEKDASPGLGYKTSRSGNHYEYILLKSSKRKRLDSLASDFDNYFSSPSIINANIYYWKITEEKGNSPHKIFAAQFDIKTHQIKDHYLFSDYIEVDDEGYFPPAYLDNGQIVFEFVDNKKWKFSTDDFKLIK